MKTIQIAIDGPAGAGKSTISKAAAKALGFTYIDTGAMYRAAALFIMRAGVSAANAPAVIALLERINIDIAYADGEQRIFLNGEDVSGAIRTPAVSAAASDVSAIPEVRLKLVRLQRALAGKRNVIMDGRDIGTFVLPDADIKIFLTADPDDRAKRRYNELLEKGERVDLSAVKEDMKRRDENDSSRAFAPLRPADDAIMLDTTGNELDESIEYVIKTIRERMK